MQVRPAKGVKQVHEGPSAKMTAALAPINADFMIGTPAAPTALGVDYLIFEIDPGPDCWRKVAITLTNSGIGWSLGGSSATRKLSRKRVHREVWPHPALSPVKRRSRRRTAWYAKQFS